MQLTARTVALESALCIEHPFDARLPVNVQFSRSICPPPVSIMAPPKLLAVLPLNVVFTKSAYAPCTNTAPPYRLGVLLPENVEDVTRSCELRPFERTAIAPPLFSPCEVLPMNEQVSIAMEASLLTRTEPPWAPLPPVKFRLASEKNPPSSDGFPWKSK